MRLGPGSESNPPGGSRKTHSIKPGVRGQVRCGRLGRTVALVHREDAPEHVAAQRGALVSRDRPATMASSPAGHPSTRRALCASSTRRILRARSYAARSSLRDKQRPGRSDAMYARTVLFAASVLLAACQTPPQSPAPAAPTTTAAAAPAAPAPAVPRGLEGRGPEYANWKLPPHAPRMTPTPASEIPLSSFKLPPGFTVEIWASGIPGARAMARGDGGKIYVGTRSIGRVYEITDSGHNAPAASSSTTSRSLPASHSTRVRCT